SEQEIEHDGTDDQRDSRETALLAGIDPASGGGQADRRHGVASSPSAPAIALRIWTLSTIPTSPPSSTTRVGLSVPAAAETTVGMIAVDGNDGPVRSSSGVAARAIQRSVRTRLFGTSRTKSST